jgi:hypothetical protein
MTKFQLKSKIEETLNSKISAKFCGVPFDKEGKIMKYKVVVSPITGFRSPIQRFFKTFDKASKFADYINR